MEISKEDLLRIVKSLIDTKMPEGVVNVGFRLTEFETVSDTYYLSLIYVVPDNSEFLNSTRSFINSQLSIWNKSIINSIESFLDIRIIKENSSIYSISEYNKKYKK